MSKPDWLPDMHHVDPWTHETYDQLYSVFENDFVSTKPLFNGQSVGYDTLVVDGKENGFWHITTKTDEKTNDRLPDPRRCEKLPWLKPMLENSDKAEVLAWEEVDGKGVTKIYVWLEDHDYIAVIKKNKKGRLYLLTAYSVDYPNVRRRFLRQYNNARVKY